MRFCGAAPCIGLAKIILEGTDQSNVKTAWHGVQTRNLKEINYVK